jgi:hypothetical protein
MAKVPVIRLDHLTDELERRAYTLADNRIALDASWDDALLAQEMAAIEVAALGQLAGFGRKEIDALLAEAEAAGLAAAPGLTNPDAAPGLPAEPIAIGGDLWAMGRHRLLCGHATSPAIAQFDQLTGDNSFLPQAAAGRHCSDANRRADEPLALAQPAAPGGRTISGLLPRQSFHRVKSIRQF